MVVTGFLMGVGAVLAYVLFPFILMLGIVLIGGLLFAGCLLICAIAEFFKWLAAQWRRAWR